MEFKDYYKILGVDADADDKAIKTAYRKLARKYHPDVSDDRDAEKRFKEVAEAYQVLKDPQKRAEYDELRRYGGRQGQPFEPPPGWQSYGGGGFNQPDGDFSDFFEAIFGGGFRQQAGAQARHEPFGRRGQDVEIDMPIFLEDTLSDESKPVSYVLPQYDSNGLRGDDVRKTLQVKIPAGVSDGERIRLKGQGAPGIGGQPSGDLYLRIRLVPHPLFDVEAHNLIITVPVAPWEAALGAKITVPTLSGDIALSIPPNSQAGQRLRVKGRGLASKNGRGDLYAVIKVVMPKNAAAAEADWQTLSGKLSFNPRAEWENR
jgi:curved DNA-binding protein